ncbi:hypothetical protein O3M35_007931 [Rhynocoris fuscipes]|uniref:Transmembrane protein 62 n=1 Tax=Rhynocoris fuscipes TaxID=488301 RepID=A0AAW1DDN1_9HEMI
MKITKAGITAVILILMLSMFVANIANLIYISDYSAFKDSKKRQHLAITNSTEHLMWFIQISDLHLSIFQDKERITEFQEFCDQTLKVIQPLTVLATGDLTDSKQEDTIGSKQFEEEWKKYKNVLDKCNSLQNIRWLDIRGNHDNFDVPGVDSSKNYFRSYSMQGKSHLRSYIEILSKGGEKYAFIGLDACPDQGLKRPFNFVGIIQEKEMKELDEMSSKAGSVANYTIWFGHYPTSCILSHGPGIRPTIGSAQNSVAYLCGHFHSMLGFVPNMYTIQRDGFLELELSDWKDNRMYRVAAIDHGLFSFVDVKHREWPLILITNPKHALYQLHDKEPTEAIRHSSYIRILVFSPDNILAVRIKLNDGAWTNCYQSKSEPHLYLHEWNPDYYANGLHNIHVSVLDEAGRERSITQPFSVDGSSMKFGVIPRMLLMLNFSASLQILFGVATVLSVLPLCFLRFVNQKYLARKKPMLQNGWLNSWVRCLWILANIDRFFIPIVLYPLYIAAGPWAIGELIEGHIGVIFIWGIFINGTYIPGSFTYGYGFVQLLFFQGPLVVFTACALDRRLNKSTNESNENPSSVDFLRIIFQNLPFIVILVLQLGMAYAFWLAYGTMSVILGPIRLWPILLTIWACYHANTIPLRKIRSAGSAWLRLQSAAADYNYPTSDQS